MAGRGKLPGVSGSGKLSLDDRLALLTAKMLREEGEGGSGPQYREFVDTPGSPEQEPSVPKQSTMARRLAEYRARFKVKAKSAASTVVKSTPEPPCLPSPEVVRSPSVELPPFQPPPQQPEMWHCKICGNKVPSESLFQMHLTTTHFRERIMRRLPRKPPYSCLLCGYTPPAVMSDTEKVEDLLMHYGTAERVAAKFYEETDQSPGPSEQMTSDVPTVSPASSVECGLCDLVLDSDRSLLKHLTLRHFPKQLCDDLPKRFPFRCPFIDCSLTRTSLHSLMLHYGVDHKVSHEIYSKHQPPGAQASPPGPPDLLPTGPFHCAGCVSRPNFPSESQYKQHIILTHLFPSLPLSGPVTCPKCGSRKVDRSEFAQHFLISHHADLTLLSTGQPKMQQVPGGVQCAVVQPYQPEADVSKQEAEQGASSSNFQTPSRVSGPGSSGGVFTRVMKTVHQHGTGSKQAREKVMRNWEANSLESQKMRIDELEEKIETLQKDHQSKLREKQTEFERWIVAKESLIEDETRKRKTAESTNTSLEKMLSEKVLAINQLIKDKQDLERLLDCKIGEVDDLNLKVNENELLAKDMSSKLDSKEVDILTLETLNQDKDDALLEMKVEMKKVQDKEEKLQKSKDKTILNMQSKNAKLLEEKNLLCKKLKEKEQVEKNYQLVEETETLINELEIERDDAKDALASFQSQSNEEISSLKSKIDDLESSNAENQSKLGGVKGLEKEKKELSRRVKQLEKTLAEWETRQFTNLKLIGGLEKERDNLQVKLKETQDGKLSHEDQLYWKNVEIRNRGKEIKRLEEKITQLEVDVESKSKCLTEAETALIESQAKNEDSSENVDSAKLQEEVNNLKNEILHLKKSLRQKSAENATLKSTTVCQKTEMDRMLVEARKVEDEYSEVVAQLETLKNTNSDITKKNKLKDEELRDLKNKLYKTVDKEKVTTLCKSRHDAIAEKEEKLEAALDIRDSELSDLQLTDIDNTFEDIESVKSGEDAFSDIVSIIKEEPIELSDHEPNFLNMDENQIVLKYDELDLVADVKDEPVETADVDDDETESDPTNLTIAPWPAFVTLASHPELVKTKNAGKKREADNEGKVESSATKKGKKSTLEDVTEQYLDLEEDEQVLCGICDSWDPPDSGGPQTQGADSYTTEWVGCDCDRWFHKGCTKLKRFTDKFSCRSVKLKCQEQP